MEILEINNITTFVELSNTYSFLVIWACIIIVPLICMGLHSYDKVKKMTDGKHPFLSFDIDSVDLFTYEEKEGMKKFED